jgi:peptidoglycan/xylan/chitin deacetylase (PgdA/CDA1 family)
MKNFILALVAILLVSCGTTDPRAERLESLRKNYDKFIALSFDDGPSQTTMQILDLVEQYDIRASFFVIGERITPETEHIVKRAVALGCDIENHSLTHPHMSQLSAEEQAHEATATTQIIERYAPTPKYFRPPYIDHNEVTHGQVPQIFIAGYSPKDWDSSVSAEERIEKLMQNSTDGMIYLLHDFAGNTATVEALKKVIPTLKEKGFTFVTVDELFALKGAVPEKGVIYSRVD